VIAGIRPALEAAIGFVLECGPKFRIPEPLRQARRPAAFPHPGRS